jgi:PAS domain S-box-containing protein
MAEFNGIQDPRVAELLCHLVMQTPTHAFILLEPDGKILWCNPGTERLFSVTSETIVGRNFHEIFTDQDRAAGIDRLEIETARSDAISEDDRWHVRSDGSAFWSSGALVQLRGTDNGELLGFGKVIRDRTDLKTQLDLRENQRDRLQAMNRNIDRAITQLSHELRNVISGMRGAVEILDTPLDDEPRRKKFAQLMQRQLAMIERLTEDVLDVKRAEGGKIGLQLESLSLQRELRAMLEGLEHRFRERRLTVQLLAPSSDIIVNADARRLQQVFGNLLDNAIKYTPADGRIWVKITTEDQYAVVHIEDTGRGIPHDQLRAIFELFTQVDAQHSSGGLGVGLALVRELVQLQAISKGAGEGSEFSVRLPAASRHEVLVAETLNT